jgi:hypothetical protein
MAPAQQGAGGRTGKRMSVKELIEHLSNCKPDEIVMAFNGDTGKIEPITGMLYGGTDGIVELCTDGMNT